MMASQETSASAQAVGAATSAQQGPAQEQKRIHSLIVDTGPLIKNEPALSTLLAQAEELYTIPSVLAEIKASHVSFSCLPFRDEATRSRVQTTLLPFLKLRSPKPDSIRFITDFSRRTGDLEVLSKPDIHLLALSYELELERNKGDWRLRRDPTQRRLNGKPLAPTNDDEKIHTQADQETANNKDYHVEDLPQGQDQQTQHHSPDPAPLVADIPAEPTTEPSAATSDLQPPATTVGDDAVESKLQQLSLGEAQQERQGGDGSDGPVHTASDEVEEDEDEDDDDGSWITPSNLKKHQAKDAQVSAPSEAIQETLQVALLTSDFAMQNVALRINLNIVSPSNLSRIKQLKTWVLRCYGCFHVTRQMDRQFCPKCGQATMTRTSSSTDSNGNMRLHLKKNFQYNKRGNVYSIPKPTHGSANGKLANVGGGGKNHWGSDLILAEDQKEYSRRTVEDRRARQRDLMDEDYLPNLLTGERTGGHGRIRVGAGRNVNSKKRR